MEIMKKNMKKLLFTLCAGVVILSGCSDSVIEDVINIPPNVKMETYMINEPVFMSEKEFRESVIVSPEPQPINNCGKMCFYEGYIYISESGKGIHIINNTDPLNPQNVGFIELLGNADLAIHKGKLYADALIDLVWFDIINPEKPVLEGRIESVFAKTLPLPPTDNEFSIDYNMCYDMLGSKGVVVGWELKERTEIYEYYEDYEDNEIDGGTKQLALDAAYGVAANASGSSVGVNSSMSQFVLYNDYLYSVINNTMSTFDLSGNKPVKVTESIYLGWNVEAIFSYKDNIFMGASTGMVIYSISNPLKPEYTSSVSLALGRHPVVVENDIAYVAVNSQNNNLLIYDVSDVKSPRRIAAYNMKNPKGLGIDNGILFVCDDGLKVFDASEPKTLMTKLLAHYSDIEGYDVIPFNNVLIMMAEDGLYQYDYSDLSEIKELSKLPIIKE